MLIEQQLRSLENRSPQFWFLNCSDFALVEIFFLGGGAIPDATAPNFAHKFYIATAPEEMRLARSRARYCTDAMHANLHWCLNDVAPKFRT